MAGARFELSALSNQNCVSEVHYPSRKP